MTNKMHTSAHSSAGNARTAFTKIGRICDIHRQRIVRGRSSTVGGAYVNAWRGDKASQQFFFARKHQKTFARCRQYRIAYVSECRPKQIKVSWFFFSKKNGFPVLFPHGI
jgi:hypothetical protein